MIKSEDIKFEDIYQSEKVEDKILDDDFRKNREGIKTKY